MSNLALAVHQLGKKYRIGARQQTRGLLGDQIVASVKRPAQRVASLFRANGNSNGAPVSEIFWALRDVSFEVPHGEAVGIIGRNGAGKSTLLKILSRITKPTTGRVELFGRVGSLLEVGTGFHPELTGRENIFLNGAILGMRRGEIQRRFDEIVAFAEVDEFIDTPVKRYSSGMYLRLAFAVAAHLEPDILVVDEVLAVGDAAFQKKCLGKMTDVTKAGRTVLFVSHNLAAVHSLCRECILLEHGQIVQRGTSAQVIPFYLQENVGTSAVRIWPEPSTAPGNEKARLYAVRLLGQDGTAADTFHLGEPIRVQIEYRVHAPNTRLNLSLSLYNAEGVYILASPSIADRQWYQKEHPAGNFTSSCEIPGSLLNEGKYSISVLLVENGRQVIAQADHAVSLEMMDLGEARGGYFGYWGGVVRPRLEWRTVQQQSDL